MRELILAPNPEYDESDSSQQFKYICPVTRLLFNGLIPFVVIWPTGQVLSERAIREISIEELQTEYGPFSSKDIIRLLPLQEEIPSQTLLMNERRIALKTSRKESKKRIHAENSSKINETDALVSTDIVTESKESRKKKRSGEPSDVSHSHTEHAVGDGVSRASVTVRRVTETLKKREENSAVFKGLFHKGGEADKHGRDLFMSVAGLRYSIS